MPLYEYACEACGHRFEALQSISDAPLTSCEKCGGKVERLLSSPAIQFKGTGWYVTDYAKKGSASDGSKSTEKPAEKTSESTEKSSSTETTSSTPKK